MWFVLLSLATAHASELQLLAHDPAGVTRPADRCDAALCEALVALIDGAEHTLDLAFYGFRDQSAVLAAVDSAVARGVRVRLVVDEDVEGTNYYASTHVWQRRFGGVTDHATDLASAARRPSFRNTSSRCARPPGFQGPLQCLAVDLGDGRCLLTAHVSRDPITFKGDIMHHKFAIADGRAVWTGSANASDSGTGGYNANLALVVRSEVVAGWYLAEFEQLAAGRFHKDKGPHEPLQTRLSDGTEVWGYFSPQDRTLHRHVRPLLREARDSIDIAVFFLTHKSITTELIAAARRGVRVRILLDATAASNGYSKHEILRAAGIAVKVEDWGGKMHAKAAVIDGHTLIAGSMNWTAAGERGNDENTLVVRSQVHAGQLQAWFDRLWNRVPARWLSDRPDAESIASGSACFDGVDNDFDGKADAADPGCTASPPPVPTLPPMEIVPTRDGHCGFDLLD